ncbi:MAG TPA: hypothetical protein VLH15_09315 [Dehalococcoidales bacterium]|nr:hypothetical protein [Dehalococcoidales bacterium]
MPETGGFSYEVLSPWAEADPVAWRGINPRINDLTGKKVGIYCNTKRVAPPTLKLIENRLRNQFQIASISWFYMMVPNEPVMEQPRRRDFEKWLEEVDTVIAAYGD